MEKRLPYYMAYPMPLLYDDAKVEQRDFDYMKSLYPETARNLMPYVEAECDRMEYEGSMIYDEYPDQVQIYLMCGRIYDKVKDVEGEKEWLRDLIQVVLFQELYQRRCHYRKAKKRFYFDGSFVSR
ncbi:MAG: hypothetical protein UHS49_06430 [Faecalimonas sp.]|nr:hypothetical protein [Faecalimonas sp.]